MSSIALFSVSCTKQETAETQAAGESATAYPLDVCLISGEKLGSMGEPVSINHQGQEIKFCCDSCLPKFNKDPEKYLSKLKEETAR